MKMRVERLKNLKSKKNEIVKQGCEGDDHAAFSIEQALFDSRYSGGLLILWRRCRCVLGNRNQE